MYVTDALKSIAENTAKMYGGSSMATRYADLVAPDAGEEDTRTASDIINTVVGKINNLGG